MSEIKTHSNTTLTSIYQAHQGWLQGWLCKKLGCTAQAADVVQDTFVRILQYREREGQLPEFREPKAYLTTVAGRLVYDLFRRQSIEKAYLESLARLPEYSMPSPEQLWQIRETLFELDALFDSMKPIVRRTFLLSQLEGLTYAKIAERLAVSERSVKRYMATAFEACILLMTD